MENQLMVLECFGFAAASARTFLSTFFQDLRPAFTGLRQFGAPKDGHLNGIMPVRQKENAGCILGHVGFG